MRGFEAGPVAGTHRGRADHADLRAADDVPAAARASRAIDRQRSVEPAAARSTRWRRCRRRSCERCLERFGCDFYLLFGQTEMSPTVVSVPSRAPAQPRRRRRHARGQRAGRDHGRDGALLPQGEAGEIVYRGPHTLTEYLANEEATDAAFEHGWFHSGDIGRFDADGHAVVQRPTQGRHQDRRRERRLDRGRKGALRLRPRRSRRRSWSGSRTTHWTEAITAIVVPKPGASVSADELLSRMRSSLAPYKLPKAVIAVEELPRTSTGKIQKNLVRETTPLTTPRPLAGSGLPYSASPAGATLVWVLPRYMSS